MGLISVILVIGVLNLGLGYALAVHLGYGPELHELHAPRLEGWGDSPQRLLQQLRQELAERLRRRPAPPAVTAEPSMDGLFQEVFCDEKDLAVSENAIKDMLDDDPAESVDVEPNYEPYDDDVAELLNPDQPEAWDLNEKFVETSILKLNIAMMKSGQRAVSLDARLRASRGHSDAETIRRCVEELLEDCETYLAEQSEAAEKFSNRLGELGELKSLGEQIEIANLEQAAQIETTISNLRTMDFQSDLEAANQRLLTELNGLRLARHKLRDNQEMAFMTIARYEDRIDKIENQLFNDPLTKLRNRIGLETTLCQWWKQNRQQSRQMSAALFDLDRFGKLNDEFGFSVCDKLLVKVAELIQQQLSTADLAGRFAGQQFLVVFLDVGPRTAIKTAELIRQTIDKVVFFTDQARIPLTTSTGIIEVQATENQESFLSRLEATLKHAKEAGGNHASFHNGREIELVESPSFGPKYQEIRIA